MTKVLRT